MNSESYKKSAHFRERIFVFERETNGAELRGKEAKVAQLIS